MKAFGCESSLVDKAFTFNACIQGVKFLCFVVFMMINTIGTPFLYLSNTITVFRGYCHIQITAIGSALRLRRARKK